MRAGDAQVRHIVVGYAGDGSFREDDHFVRGIGLN